MLDTVWVLTCAALVFFMQAGFCCLEAGYVRAKNSINVAAKNFCDFCISSSVFWLFGFGIMFGSSYGGFFGTDEFFHFAAEDPQSTSFFVFQMMFCGAATTIVSGAIAERARFVGYLFVTAVIAVLIYPVFGHWAWATGPDGSGWLAERGFVDFAGATVVHAVAGWVSLAAVIVIGARRGRFDQGRQNFRSANLAMSALGVFIIWVGWIGFNGGSTLAVTDQVPLIVMNTLIGGAFGGVGAILISPLVVGRLDVPCILNGGLAGLVSITAVAHAIVPGEAALIGIIGGILSLLATRVLFTLKIDDVLSAFPVHGVCGVWGTLCVALFGDLQALGTGLSRLDQLWVQTLGSLAAALWAFGAAYIVLRIIHGVISLRVSEQAERIGLNISEHAQSTEQMDLLNAMEVQRLTGDYSRPVQVEPDSDIGDIAAQYNRVLSNLYQAKIESEEANNAKSDFLAAMSHELRTPLNAIMGFSEMIKQQYFGPLGSDKYSEYAGDINRSSKHLLSLVDDILDLSKVESGRNKLIFEDVDLRDVFEDCLKITKNAIDCSQIYFEVRASETLPPAHADARAMQQIVLNILFNAVKFTPGGGKVIMLAVMRADHHMIEISDSGEGIPEQELEKITEPFAQLETNPHIAKMGTGLGLAIAKALVTAHNGDLVIESEVGQGTKVRFTIPPRTASTSE